MSVVASTRYFRNSRLFRVFAILATVFCIPVDNAIARSVCAFPIICHVITLLSSSNAICQICIFHGADLTTIVRRFSPKVSDIGLSN